LKTGFVYLWRDLLHVGSNTHPWLCIGSHIGFENDGYTTANKHCAAAIKKRPQTFEKRILLNIKFDEKQYPHSNTPAHPVRYYEQCFLDMIPDCELGKTYYNLKKQALGWPHQAIHSEKSEHGKSIHAIKAGRAGSAKTNSKKDENGKSVAGVRGGRAAQVKLTPSERSERGRQGGLKGGSKGGKTSQAKKTPRERSEQSRRGGLKGGPIAAIKLNNVPAEERSKRGMYARSFVETTKEERTEIGRRVCHIRWHTRRNTTNPNCFYCLNQ
jgi:hypothetical protein